MIEDQPAHPAGRAVETRSWFPSSPGGRHVPVRPLSYVGGVTETEPVHGSCDQHSGSQRGHEGQPEPLAAPPRTGHLRHPLPGLLLFLGNPLSLDGAPFGLHGSVVAIGR